MKHDYFIFQLRGIKYVKKPLSDEDTYVKYKLSSVSYSNNKTFSNPTN